MSCSQIRNKYILISVAKNKFPVYDYNRQLTVFLFFTIIFKHGFFESLIYRRMTLENN